MIDLNHEHSNILLLLFFFLDKFVYVSLFEKMEICKRGILACQICVSRTVIFNKTKSAVNDLRLPTYLVELLDILTYDSGRQLL